MSEAELKGTSRVVKGNPDPHLGGAQFQRDKPLLLPGFSCLHPDPSRGSASSENVGAATGNAALTGNVHVVPEAAGVPAHRSRPTSLSWMFLLVSSCPAPPDVGFGSLMTFFFFSDVFKGMEGIVFAKVNTRNSQRGFQYSRNNHAIPHKWGETRWNLLFFFPGFYDQTITAEQKYKGIFLSLGHVLRLT